MSTRKYFALLIGALIATFGFGSSQSVSAQFNGAIYTTMPDGLTVNENVGYPSKAHVYLNGGPQNANGAGLPDGIYYYQVTTPSGDLLSTDPAVCRQAVVSGGKMDGAFDVGGCQHANATAPNPDNGSLGVQLIPYDDTTNNGGEYKVWLIRQTDTTTVAPDGIVILFKSSDSKTDNFKVQLATPTPTPNLDPVTVSKTANGTYDRTVTWELEKTVDPTSHTGAAGENAGTSTWTVVATKNEVSDNYNVTGVITVTNTNSQAVTVIVNDYLDDNSTVDVDCDPNTDGNQFADVDVPGAVDQNTPGVLTCSYSAATSADATNNTASVTPVTPDLPQGDDFSVDISWVENLIGDDEVVVDDDRDTEGQFPATISDSQTFDYDETFPCSSDQNDYTDGKDSDTYKNTATLEGENTHLSDDAEVQVDCTLAALAASKTAAGTFDREHSWGLTKSANPTSFEGYAGDTFNPDDLWTVVADKTTTDGNYKVTGTITVDNPSGITQSFTVSDVLDTGTVATVDCPAKSVAAGGQVVCTYTASTADGSATLNTATVSAAGNEDQQATAAVSFSANVIGDNSTTLGDARFSFSQVISADTTQKFDDSFSCSTNLADYTNGQYSYVVKNIATLDGPNTDLEAEATVTVTCKLRYSDETATVAGLAWPGANWFMYTRCDAANPGPVNLLAGQFYDVGDVSISGTCPTTKTIGPGTNTITITLQNGARLADTSNNVKIHPMGEMPKKFIQPGQYSIKKTFTQGTTQMVITVPQAQFYGIHLDVQRVVLP